MKKSKKPSGGEQANQQADRIVRHEREQSSLPHVNTGVYQISITGIVLESSSLAVKAHHQ
jgi:hypothetical protein